MTHADVHTRVRHTCWLLNIDEVTTPSKNVAVIGDHAAVSKHLKRSSTCVKNDRNWNSEMTMTLKPQQRLTEGSSCTQMRLSVDQQRFKGCHNVRRLPNMLNEKHSSASSKYISSIQNRNCFWGTDQLKHSSDGSNYYTQIPTKTTSQKLLIHSDESELCSITAAEPVATAVRETPPYYFVCRYYSSGQT